MIHIKRRVPLIALSSDRVEHASVEMPADIGFSQRWMVSHSCNCPDGEVAFSRTNNWHRVGRLFSRFYSVEFLEALAEAFDTLRVFASQTSEFLFLTKADFDNAQAPIWEIPGVTFNHYSCTTCGSEYLCRMHEASPLEPDRRHHEGLDGRLIVHEIVEIASDGHDFSTMLRIGMGEEEWSPDGSG